MLSIAKLRVGQEAYTLAGVAQSLDDYYTGVGEASGLWLGAGAERLGLAGEVDADDLRAVLGGMAPGAGGLTPDGAEIRPHPRRVPGFDLTWKAPKSVSVLWAVSDDPRVQGAILDAGQQAVAEAIAWLEREAIKVRRGTGNEKFLADLAARDPAAAEAARIRSLPGRGLIAASFRHRTSRAGDPLLHWHTLVSNLVEGPDGRWTAFSHPDLYRALRAAGELFQAVLRAELTERLGVEWRPGRHVPEIAGVPQTLCDRFSKRSREIAAWLAATGTPGDHAGRQEAVYATRRGKPELEHERLDVAWKAEAIAAGWGPEHAEALITSAAQRHAPTVDEVWRLPTAVEGDDGLVRIVDRLVDPEEWIAGVARDLTEHDGTFTRTDVLQAVAARIGEGATVATIERIAARLFASPQIVPVDTSTAARSGAARRWTSTELLAVEQRFVAATTHSRGQRHPIAIDRITTALGAFPTLGPDQAAAVRTLTSSADAVTVLVGPAGTGKTFALNALRHVYDQSGYRVVGAAPSAKAAQELQAGAAIPSTTIHRLVASWDRGYNLPDARTVLVIDEAAMAGIRNLEEVVADVVTAGGRIVLAGDHHQLPEISAGGGFAALATDPTATATELWINRRQHFAWEADALVELRDGHVPEAVSAYREHDRVVVADDHTAMIADAVERWTAAHRRGHIPILLAGTNETVHALNTAIRGELHRLGLLGPTIDPHGRFAIGDRVMTRSNDYLAVTVDGLDTHVLNGHAGTLVGATDDGVLVHMDHDDATVVLDWDYVIDGGLTHAYATTAHRAQGGTWDVAISVGLAGLYREAAYLVMSRGRYGNWILMTAEEAELLDELARHDSALVLPDEEPPDAHDVLLSRWSASRAKQLVTITDPLAATVNHVATTVPYPTVEAWAAHAAAVEDQARRVVGETPQGGAARLARAEHTARHAAVGQLVRALDRLNVGAIVALNDPAGQVSVHFVAHDGRERVKRFDWGDVEIVRPRNPRPRQLSPAGTAHLDQLVTHGRRQIERWNNYLAQHGVQPSDHYVYARAANTAADRAAGALASAEPEWLTNLLGPRPTSRPATAQMWDDTIRTIATVRLRHNIVDPTIDTGPTATTPDTTAVWQTIAATVAEARVWLDTHTDTIHWPTGRTRSTRELLDRHGTLETVFATAPPDCRDLIGKLQTTDLLDPADTAKFLTAALATQDARARWIIEHWPHVVEYAQINHTLHHGTPGPDIQPFLDVLAAQPNEHLASAASAAEPWLVALAAQLTPADATSPDQATTSLLTAVAEHRHRWHITSRHPLGDAATHPDQADERTLLRIAIDTAADPTLDIEPDGQLVLDY